MPKKLPQNFSATDLENHRRSWADYQRMRRMPNKACTVCYNEYPNNDEYFRVGKNGWITQTCVHCKRPEQASKMVVGECPVCGENRPLLRDREGPVEIRVCRKCYSMAQRFLRFDAKMFAQFRIYQHWRNGWPGPDGTPWRPAIETFPMEAERQRAKQPATVLGENTKSTYSGPQQSQLLKRQPEWVAPASAPARDPKWVTARNKARKPADPLDSETVRRALAVRSYLPEGERIALDPDDDELITDPIDETED